MAINATKIFVLMEWRNEREATSANPAISSGPIFRRAELTEA
jgi:hypothetical protein